MTEIMDTILEVEDAIAELCAIAGDEPDPMIELEIRRLDERLRRLEANQAIFAQPA
jgi:hypothetical protein